MLEGISLDVLFLSRLLCGIPRALFSLLINKDLLSSIFFLQHIFSRTV